jgi:hypothetical protein
MEGFGLLIGHLLGDFIFQNDWLATNKSNKHPGEKPPENLPMSAALWDIEHE